MDGPRVARGCGQVNVKSTSPSMRLATAGDFDDAHQIRLK
tara:strand:+ start:486 stop:605 length:120 start_codon:yes stop_codon:yes gene_type:complete